MLPSLKNILVKFILFYLPAKIARSGLVWFGKINIRLGACFTVYTDLFILSADYFFLSTWLAHVTSLPHFIGGLCMYGHLN